MSRSTDTEDVIEREAFIRLLDATDRFNGICSHNKQPMARMQGEMILAARHAYEVLGIGRTEKQPTLAVRDDVIEQCARVADDYDHFGECGENMELSALYVKTELAAAIRALATQSQNPSSHGSTSSLGECRDALADRAGTSATQSPDLPAGDGDMREAIAKAIDPDAWHQTLPTDGCGIYWLKRRLNARSKAVTILALVRPSTGEAGLRSALEEDDAFEAWWSTLGNNTDHLARLCSSEAFGAGYAAALQSSTPKTEGEG